MATRIKWNVKAFRELRLESGVIADLEDRAERVAAAAGDGYEASAMAGKNRGRASVVTGDYAAMRDNAKHQTLLRSLDAGA